MRLPIAAIFLAIASSTQSQSFTVVSSNATKALVEELVPIFEQATGQKLTIRFGNSAALKTRIEQGEVTALEAIEALLGEEYTTRESRRIKMALQTARLSTVKTISMRSPAFLAAEARSPVASPLSRTPPRPCRSGSCGCPTL